MADARPARAAVFIDGNNWYHSLRDAGAVAAFLQDEGITAGPVRSHRIGPFAAASARFQATTRGGVLRGVVTGVQDGANVYRLLGVSAEARWPSYEPAVVASFETFERLTDRAARGAQPLRLEIVTLDRAMTLREFSQRYPSQVSFDALALLNGVDPAGQLAAGSLVKLVVGGPVP